MSIFLTVTIVIHLGTFDILFSIIHNELKREVLKELTMLFHNYKVDEVCIDGIYYEKITYVKEGKTVVELVKDQKENDFVKKTEDYTKKSNSPRQKNNTKAKIFLLYSFEKGFEFSSSNIFYKTMPKESIKEEKPIFRFFEKHSPPPEFC